MSMIQHTSRLPLALFISVLVNGVLLLGLSQLLDFSAVYQHPPVQRLLLGAFSAPVEDASPTEPLAEETRHQDIAKSLQSDLEQGTATVATSTPSELPDTVTTSNRVSDTGSQTEPVMEVERSNVQEAADTEVGTATVESQKAADTGRQTSGASTESASISDPASLKATETTAEQDIRPQRDIPEPQNNQNPTVGSLEDSARMPPADDDSLPLAQIDYRPELEYPAMAKRRRQQGQVVLRAWLTEQGELEQLSILTSSGYSLLDESALDQIRTWTFQSLANNSPHRWIQIPVEFRLR